MIALWIVAGIVLLLAAVLCIRVRLTVAYDGEPSLTLRVLGIPFKLYPRKKKKLRTKDFTPEALKKQAKKEAKKQAKKDKKRADKKAKKEEKKEQEKEHPSEKKVSIPARIRHLTRVATAALGKLFGYLDTKVSYFDAVVATGDPATTAIVYGASLAALDGLFGILQKTKKLRFSRRASLTVTPDFLADKSEFRVKITFSLRPWHLLPVAFAAGAAYLKKD